MVCDPQRGLPLELSITKLLYSSHAERIQLIGMSATMGGRPEAVEPIIWFAFLALPPLPPPPPPPLTLLPLTHTTTLTYGQCQTTKLCVCNRGSIITSIRCPMFPCIYCHHCFYAYFRSWLLSFICMCFAILRMCLFLSDLHRVFPFFLYCLQQALLSGKQRTTSQTSCTTPRSPNCHLAPPAGFPLP